MKLKNITLLFAVILMSVFTTSCSWLDVSPADEISAEEMFKEPKGFHNVLNGIYLKIGEPALYGGTLSWKEMEAWGGAYIVDRDVQEGLFALMNREYNNKKVEGIGETIWTNAYKNIARINMFLEYADQKPDEFFTYGATEKKLLTGEALALRAYLHFDLLRIFAPDMKTDPEAVRIPYVSKFRSLVNPPMPSSAVMKQIRTDLDVAASFLAEYDNVEERRGFVTDEMQRFDPDRDPEWGSFFASRGIRMNYFAIRVLQARVALYDQDFEAAIQYAGEIKSMIDDKSFELEDKGQIENSPKLLNETLFAFHYTKLLEASQDFFNLTGHYVLKIEDYKNFAKNKEDGRFHLIRNSVYTIYTDDDNKKLVPALRLGEIYYILAEANLMSGKKEEAVKIFNELLTARGETVLSPEIKQEDLIQFMIDDARKEFAGMGQVVFMCKRLNERLHNSAGKLPEATLGKYVMPIPVSEDISNK